MTVSAFWLAGSRPFSCMATATPYREWVCMTKCRCGMAVWMAPWMTNPARLAPCPVSLCTFAVPVHHDQRGGRDFLEEHAEGVQQEGIVRTRQTRRNVGVVEVRPSVERAQPVGRGKVAPRLPFLAALMPTGLPSANVSISAASSSGSAEHTPCRVPSAKLSHSHWSSIRPV